MMRLKILKCDKPTYRRTARCEVWNSYLDLDTYRSFHAKLADESARRSKNLNTIVARVSHNYISFLVNSYSIRSSKHSFIRSLKIIQKWNTTALKKLLEYRKKHKNIRSKDLNRVKTIHPQLGILWILRSKQSWWGTVLNSCLIMPYYQFWLVK